jgi:hypothetical protein
MSSYKVLTSVILSIALPLGAVYLVRHQSPRLPENFPGVRRSSVEPVAPVTGPAEGTSAPRTITQGGGTAVPEPVAEGPGDDLSSGDAHESATVSEPVPAAPVKVEFETVDLLSGTQQGVVEAAMRGNGRERMSAQLRNNSPAPLRVTLPAGLVLDSGRNRVVVTRSAWVELMPAKSAILNLGTAALLSTNTVADAAYRCSYQNADRVEAFLSWAAEHPEIPAPAMQAAVLVLTENLPLNALARFAPVNGTAGSLNTDAFRVETGDLIAALGALRASGTKMEAIALAVDPQLRIEAMIEPLSREAAKRYYGISEEQEWDFWKRELLEGNPSTRHYALFGIARFYPEIALDMLPKWVREAQTHPVYRLAAAQALADTQRAEALPILRQLADEVGPQTDLGKTAAQAAVYLDKRLTELASRSRTVAFRSRTPVAGL